MMADEGFSVANRNLYRPCIRVEVYLQAMYLARFYVSPGLSDFW
jgi:hypothetical protein